MRSNPTAHVPHLILLAALAALLLAPAPAAAASLPADSTAILSGARSLFEPLPAPVNYSGTDRWAVSYDGRYVAFSSDSDGLLEGDDDSAQNVYVKDRASGAVTLVSRASGPNGEPNHGRCGSPAISDDGTRVAFVCDGRLDPDDTNGMREDVYVRDLGSSATILVSRVSGLGPVADRASARPALSADGTYVAFESDAQNLDPPTATGGGSRIYRREIGGANATIVVSRRSLTLGDGAVFGHEPSISDDGNRVAFTHDDDVGVPSNDPADNNGEDDVFVRDVANGLTILASRAAGANGAVGNGPSGAPAIAGDGSAVAFESRANQFDFAADPDKDPDIYRRSLGGSPNTVLVNVNSGGQRAHDSTAPSIDRSGNVVGFVTAGVLVDADDGSSPDAYLKYLNTNEVDAVSRADGAIGRVANRDARAVAVSGDGTKAAVELAEGSVAPGADPREGAVILRDLAANPRRTHAISRPAGDAPFVNVGRQASSSAVTPDGRYIAFTSGARGHGLPEGAELGVFVRDRVTGDVTYASRHDGPDGAPIHPNQSPAISADGRRVAFTVTRHTDRGVWVRDVGTNRTYLASRADGPAGAAGDGGSSHPSLDADGTRVAFDSTAANLGNGDSDAAGDVHVRDLETGRTILVSRADGDAGPKGNGASDDPSISADGTRVSFDSSATNLGDGDTDPNPDVHLRDIAAATTRLVSATPDGTKGNGDSFHATLDAAGTRVAFESRATNLPGSDSPVLKAFVRDLAANTLVLASRADGRDGAPADAVVRDTIISPDGEYVGFESSATNLAPGAPAGVRQVYLRDVVGGRTVLVSRAPGGAPAPADSTLHDVSAGGACVSFGSGATLIGPYSDFDQVYMRVLGRDCVPVPRAPGDGAGPGDADGDGPKPDGEPARDTTAPVISRARLSRKRFRVGRAATVVSARRTPAGTVLSFRSSEAATLTLAFERRVRGRGRKTRYKRAGALTRTIRAGTGRLKLSGRLGRKRMTSGAYRLTLVARDAAGNRSKAVRLSFRVVPR